MSKKEQKVLSPSLQIAKMRDLGNKVVAIAQEAGEGVLQYYNNTDLSVRLKNDGSPVTEADHFAHEFIKQNLQPLLGGIPRLSEESASHAPYAERKLWSSFWLIDPLDGTREFLQQTDLFSVNIALIVDGEPVLGVVNIPVTGETYLGVLGEESYRFFAGEKKRISSNKISSEKLNVLLSKRRKTPRLEQCLSVLEQQFSALHIEKTGSSIKFCRIAEGRSDFFPCLGPTSQWDSAAAQAVVEGAGGEVLDSSGNRLLYNRENLINPFFYVLGDKDYPWRNIIQQIES